MPTIPVLTPVRMARITLAGLVIAGMASSGIAMAAGWTGPSSPAPFNNTPELIWNAQETGFTPQDASFNITGSGVLGQFAAGGYDLDAGGISMTAPSLWATDFGAGNATVFNDLIIDPATGGLSLGGVRLTAWPASGDGDVTGIAAGPNLVGGGDTGEISLDLSSTPSVDSLTANTSVVTPSLTLSTPDNARIFWNTNFGFNRVEFTTRPHFGQGLTTAVGTTALFSGPVEVNGGYRLSVQGQVAASSLCALSGAACSAAPYVLGQTISAQTFCIGSDCRTAWPAGGGGGGGGTVTSVGTGTGLTGGPITGAGSLSLDTAYTDGRYINSAGNELKSGTLRIEDTVPTPLLSVTNSGAGSAIIATGSDNAIYAQGTIAGSFNNNTGVNTHAGLGTTSAGGEFSYNGTNRANISSSVFAGDFTGPVRVTGDEIVSGDLSPGRLCLAGVCNASWPAGGGGAFVLKAGDTMTGNLIVNSRLEVRSTAAGTAAGYFNSTAADGLITESATGYGIEASTTSGPAGGLFLRGGTTVSVGTATRGVDSNRAIQAPEYCIGASCITSWPAGGGSTSITAGTGVTVSPSPITGAGTISVNTTYTDSRYVNNTGPDQVIGEFAVNSTSGFQSLDVGNTGGGNAIDAQSSSNTTIVARNSSPTGAAGYFHNGSFVDTYLAWGGTYGVYTNGQVYSTGNVRGASVTIGSVTKSAWPTYSQVTRTNIAITGGWNNAPAGCPAGSKVTGISCFTWDAANNWPGCTSRADASQETLELYGNGSNISYTLFCVSGL